MTETATDVLLYEDNGAGVVRLTLNRPRQYNALSEALLGALEGALARIAADANARVVVLAANGPAFCAGHDLKEMRGHTDRAYHQALFQRCSGIMQGLQRLPQPVIARVHGLATAAGCQLVATCDLAVAVSEARFATSGINLGLFCATPAVALSRNLGRKPALEMLLTGDFLDAAEAQRLGLVNRVVAADALDGEIQRLTASICAKPAVAVTAGKRMFYAQLEMGTAAAYAHAADVMACNMDTDEAREGVDAFMQRRAPSWAG